MASFFQDVRFSLRVLVQSPGFSVAVIVILALGLGATMAIFTVVDQVLLRPLPYPHPERIVRVGGTYREGADFGVTRGAQFRFLQQQSRSFEWLESNDVVLTGVNLSDGTEPERVSSVFVSAEFFRVLGVSPALGRAFTVEDDRNGSACVAVFSDSLWRRRYNSDRSIAGRTVAMNGESCSVVGILPPGFRFHLEAEVFRPIQIPRVPRDLGHYYNLLARLKPGVLLEQARAELQTLFAQFKVAHGDLVDEGEVGFETRPYLDALVGDVRPALWVLLCAVCLVLAIACVNVANLLLARLARRAREVAVRAALGATRLRLIRQFIVESLLLAMAAGFCGLFLAHSGVPALLRLAPSGLPRAADIVVDGRVAGSALIISTLTVLVFGAVPAISMTRVDVNAWLKAAGRHTSSGLPIRLAPRILIGAEVALSLVLLSGGGLLMHSFAGLRRVSPGFDPRNILTFKMSLPAHFSTTPLMWEYEHQVLKSLATLPGVGAAASAICLPMEVGPDMPTAILGRSASIAVNPAYRPVSPDYFRVLRIPVIHGRSFVDSDTFRSVPVALINETMAREVLRDRNPIGQRIQLGPG